MKQACPFTTAPHLERIEYFVGRREPLRRIADRLNAAQPTSLNLHGPRRVGKTWLLRYFYLTWSQHLDPARRGRYVAIYLDGTDTQCRGEAEFLAALAAALRDSEAARLNPELAAAWEARTDWSLARLDRGLRTWKDHGLMPLLCLDNADHLVGASPTFSEDFQHNLRSHMDHGRLVLLGTSRELLQGHPRPGHHSPLFNNAEALRLEEFSEAESKALLKLPWRGDNGEAPALPEAWRAEALRWAGPHPWRLQVAARALWDAGRDGHSPARARREYLQQLENREHGRPGPWQRLTDGLARLGRARGEPDSRLSHILLGATWLGKTLRGLLLALAGLALALAGQLPAWLNSLLNWLKGL